MEGNRKRRKMTGIRKDLLFLSFPVPGKAEPGSSPDFGSQQMLVGPDQLVHNLVDLLVGQCLFIIQ